MRIIHPRPALGRQSALGVDFRDGVAVVESLHPERELALIRHGYTIEPDLEVEAPHQEAIGEPIIDLAVLSRAELRDIAEVEGLEVTTKMTRDQLIKAISSLPATPIPGDVDNGDGSFTGGV
ncbi:Rho termination factor N-terminal domain-containing protein [Microbacterium sp. BR1]|uniref:Rho termination factor N-terminal domain-containing protein n=1 Tax=Microbacterium sp. BR1 TaxID=1070896 RepID=UPI000C2C8406|nr:Rho termination factor N-terminal domain-containing protein [Microbacterium sp. BR1]